MSRSAGSSTPVVLGFIVIALVTLGGQWRLDVTRAAGRQAAAAIDTNILMASQGLDQLRGAQAGYLSSGQKTQDWFSRGTAAAMQLDGAIASLEATSTSREAKNHYDAAAALLVEIAANDKKARDFIASEQTLVASDVLFQEGLEPARKLAAELVEARSAEIASFEKSATTLARIAMGANAATLLVAALCMAYIIRTRSTPSNEATSSSASNAFSLESVAQPQPSTLEPFPDPFAASTVDLTGAADLCVDLGRILDARDLQGLMARAGTVLEAKGLVLWVSEANGTILRPSIAHGYPDRVLQRMGTLPADGDNVTSLAFRTCQPQVLRSSFDGHGALAVPLMTATGCVGVLAAEVQGAKPGDTRFAIARMIAAQLSTLVGPGSSSSMTTTGTSL
jgi:hypothetical protein